MHSRCIEIPLELVLDSPFNKCLFLDEEGKRLLQIFKSIKYFNDQSESIDSSQTIFLELFNIVNKLNNSSLQIFHICNKCLLNLRIKIILDSICVIINYEKNIYLIF